MNSFLRKSVGLAGLLVVGTSSLFGQNAPAPAPVTAAVKPAVFEMATFTKSTADPDAAFTQALASVAKSQAEAKQRGETPAAVLNLEKNGIYKIKRTLEIAQLDSFEINGNGARLINTTLGSTLHFTGCDHVTVRNLSVDYDPLPFTQGTITAFDKTGRYVNVKVDVGYPDDAKFLANITDGFFQVMDRKTRSLKPGARSFLEPDGVQRLGTDLIKVHLQWSANDCGPGQLPIAVGNAVTVCGGNAHAIVIEGSTATSFLNFNLYASPGMGILENGGTGGTVLQNVTIAPGPKPPGATADRLICTNSDGSHFITVEHGPRMENCTFSNTSDDAVNVHGFYYFVLQKSGPRTYQVSPKWDIGLEVGDQIETCEKSTCRSLGQTKILRLTKKQVPALKARIALLWKNKSATTLPDTIYEIELEKDLPLKPGDAITSLTRIGTGTTIQNCSFHACGRVMIKSPDSLVENCRFSYSSGAALQAGSDIGYWAESDFARNVTFRNNTFTHCNTGANDFFPDSNALGTIYIGMTPIQGTKGFGKNFENRNVTIENNKIDDSYLYAIFVTNSDGVKILNNRIGPTFIRGSAYAAGQLFGIKPNSGVFLGMSRNAEVNNNTVTRGAVTKTAVQIDRTCPPNSIVHRDNALN